MLNDISPISTPRLSRGFSMLELVVAVGIIAIITSISIPTYTRFKRTSAQAEARTSLTLVHQAQKSYFTEHQKWSKNFKLIGALPSGRLRYNVGADWGGSNGTTNYSDNNHCAGCCSTTNTEDPCCMEGGSSCDTNPCYGGAITTMATKITAIKSGTTTESTTLTGHKFTFYAIGCTAFGKSAPADLDVWSIDERQFLNNIVNGANN